MLFDVLRKLFPSAKLKKCDDGSVNLQYKRPTRFYTKISSENQIDILERVIDNAGVKR